MTGMNVSYGVFRGSSEGKIISDQTTSILEHGDVFIETTHSGLCGTDEHYLKSGQVLGHEGVGIIKAVGPGVTSVKVGDRVGFGYTHSICANCDNCASGKFSFSSYLFITQENLFQLCLTFTQQAGINFVGIRSNMGSMTFRMALSATAQSGMPSVSIKFPMDTILPMLHL